MNTLECLSCGPLKEQSQRERLEEIQPLYLWKSLMFFFLYQHMFSDLSI